MLQMNAPAEAITLTIPGSRKTAAVNLGFRALEIIPPAWAAAFKRQPLLYALFEAIRHLPRTMG